MRPRPLRLLALLPLAACAPFAADAPPATSNRPLLSEDTATTAAGHFETELGARFDHDDQLDLPTALKYGAGERTEVFAEFSPWVHVQHVLDGHGDILLGARHRLRDTDDSGPSFAFQGGIELPVGDDEAGGGQTDAFAAAIATQHWDCTALTGFYQFGGLALGERELEVEHLLAVAASHSLSQRLSLFGELAGVVRPESDSEASVWTFGVAYATAPWCIFDIALAAGNGDLAPDLQLFVGVTCGLNHLFAREP